MSNGSGDLRRSRTVPSLWGYRRSGLLIVQRRWRRREIEFFSASTSADKTACEFSKFPNKENRDVEPFGRAAPILPRGHFFIYWTVNCVNKLPRGNP